MKSTGIVRKIDSLGRVVLPVELRKTLNVNEGDSLEILVNGSAVVLRKHEETCIFCDKAENISSFKGKNVCPKCAAELAQQ